MVAKDFPCKTCRHLADKHYSNIATSETVCIDCSPAYDRSTWTTLNEHVHEFIGDNLAYVELQKRKQELLNEQA